LATERPRGIRLERELLRPADVVPGATATEQYAAAGAYDAALVARAVAGDADAVTALVRRHLPAAYAVARAIVADHADAEDVCQDAFAAVLARLEACRPAERFRAWLLRSVRNRAICVRRWRRVRSALVLGAAPGEVDAPAPAADCPLAAAERADLRARLTAALGTLSDAQRTVVLLHDVEGWSHREIGALLDIAEGTSRTSLFAARRRLRAQLGSPLGRAAGPAVVQGAG
jgi:RNA polymerase sigma-70 factor (ECF subfamily)